MYRIRYSTYTRAYISRGIRPPSQVTSNSIIARSLLCAPVTHPNLSREIDGERWLLSFFLSLTWAPDGPPPLSHSRFLFAPVSLNYFIFVFNFILGVSATLRDNRPRLCPIRGDGTAIRINPRMMEQEPEFLINVRYRPFHRSFWNSRISCVPRRGKSDLCSKESSLSYIYIFSYFHIFNVIILTAILCFQLPKY